MPAAALQPYFWAQQVVEPPVPVEEGSISRVPRPLGESTLFWSVIPVIPFVPLLFLLSCG